MRIERGLVETPYGYIHYRRAGRDHPRTVVVTHISQQSSALMIELLEALGGKVQAVAVDYPSCGMSDHHYLKDLPHLEALAHGSEAEVIPGARFCVTWSHAQYVAARTLAFMGA